ETPFVFQGFPLKTLDDVANVRKVCKYVYIDTDLGKDSRHSIPATKVAKSIQMEMEKIPASIEGPRYPVSVPIEKESKVAAQVHHRTRGIIKKYMDDVRSGKSISTDTAKEIVGEAVESIIRNPNALMCYTLLKNRDHYTSEHSLNVCIMSLAFGRHLGFSEEVLNELGVGALLHDLGKMKIPLDLLHKDGKLTPEEFDIIKKHPEHGRAILEEAGGMSRSAIDIAYSHHERNDGRGYPEGKVAKDMSLYSKVVAIVDVYDAITSNRSYHDGISSHDALKRMYEWRETDFDPELLEKFIQCLGIYPIGSIVELNTGDVGVVIEVDPQRRLKPKVMLVLDPDKKLRTQTRIVDLGKDRIDFIEEGAELEIVQVLDPGAYDGSVMKSMFDSQLLKVEDMLS
ncbi:MAG: HD-GYP domain-containing protein, partial [Gammaproteobacteria bacterium]|nr:HD-GYP domain-containing protein [Gammaproteobacteria bacterium]